MENEQHITWNMDTILKKWKQICEERHYQTDTKNNLAVYMGALGEAYILLEGIQHTEQQEAFIEQIVKEKSVLQYMQGTNHKEFIQLCVKAGIYKMELLASVGSIYEQTSLSKESKETKIYREYILQNTSNLYELERIMGLSFAIEETIEKTAEKMSLYEEELEDIYDSWSNYDDEEE